MLGTFTTGDPKRSRRGRPTPRETGVSSKQNPIKQSLRASHALVPRRCPHHVPPARGGGRSSVASTTSVSYHVLNPIVAKATGPEDGLLSLVRSSSQFHQPTSGRSRSTGSTSSWSLRSVKRVFRYKPPEFRSFGLCSINTVICTHKLFSTTQR